MELNQQTEIENDNGGASNRLLAALSRRDFSLVKPYLVPRVLDRGQVLFEPGEDITTTYFPRLGVC